MFPYEDISCHTFLNSCNEMLLGLVASHCVGIYGYFWTLLSAGIMKSECILNDLLMSWKSCLRKAGSPRPGYIDFILCRTSRPRPVRVQLLGGRKLE